MAEGGEGDFSVFIVPGDNTSPLTVALLAAAAAAAWAAAAAANADDPDADDGKLTLSNCFNNRFFWVASFDGLPSDLLAVVFELSSVETRFC